MRLCDTSTQGMVLWSVTEGGGGPKKFKFACGHVLRPILTVVQYEILEKLMTNICIGRITIQHI